VFKVCPSPTAPKSVIEKLLPGKIGRITSGILKGAFAMYQAASLFCATRLFAQLKEKIIAIKRMENFD
jgi:hypothetical protein